MSNSLFVPPIPVNEVVRAYELDSIDRREVLKAYKHLNTSRVDIPLYVGEQQIFTTKRKSRSYCCFGWIL